MYVCVCMYVCTYVRRYVCMYVHIFVHVRVCVCLRPKTEQLRQMNRYPAII